MPDPLFASRDELDIAHELVKAMGIPKSYLFSSARPCREIQNDWDRLHAYHEPGGPGQHLIDVEYFLAKYAAGLENRMKEGINELETITREARRNGS